MPNATLTREEVVYAIDSNVQPRLTVEAPAEVLIETHDARGGRLRRPEDVEATAPDYRDEFPRTNPATGPIAIAGAKPGDSIVIDVLDIELDDRGYILAKPNFGVLQDFIEQPVARMCSVADGHVEVCGIRLPLAPNDRRARGRTERRATRHGLCRFIWRKHGLQPDRGRKPRATPGSGRRRPALRRRRARNDG